VSLILKAYQVTVPSSATVVPHNLAAQEPHLVALDSWRAIRAWLDALVESQVAVRARGGCPVGSLVGQLAEIVEAARVALADSFGRWQEPLREGLHSMQARGKLARSADPDELATATMASIQGGLLLTQVRRDPRQLAIALDADYAHLRAHAACASGSGQQAVWSAMAKSQLQSKR
jgi:TetR/AcrR family transcriptional regulator, transcriptional repressor for nem operon